MKWESAVEVLDVNVHRFHVLSRGKKLSFNEVAVLLQHEADFQSWFSDRLKDVPMRAYFWETPPVTKSNFNRDFEFVLINAPTLALERANPSAFVRYFNDATTEVVHFHNLGRDALLIAPVPLQADDDYAHLACFLRNAPQRQINALWETTFRTLTNVLSATAIWVSTSGLGVAWVHVRLDSVPKYYNHRPYKKSD